MDYKIQKPSSTLEGLTDGFYIGIDPIGTLCTHLKDAKTIGGRGLRRLNKDFTQRGYDDLNLWHYRAGKVGGVVVGTYMQVLSATILLYVTALADRKIHKKYSQE